MYIQSSYTDNTQKIVLSDKTEVLYLPIQHGEWYDTLKGITDVCDLETGNFITPDEFFETYGSDEYYIDTHLDIDELRVFKIAPIAEKILLYLDTVKGRKKWHPIEDIFPNTDDYILDRIIRYINLPNTIYSDTYLYRGKDSLGSFRKAYEYGERNNKPEPIFKFGRTRSQLNCDWNCLVMLINEALKDNKIPMKLLQSNKKNLTDVIKTIKKMGITYDDVFSKRSKWYQKETMVMLQKMWKNPATYSTTAKKQK